MKKLTLKQINKIIDKWKREVTKPLDINNLNPTCCNVREDLVEEYFKKDVKKLKLKIKGD